MTMIRRYFAGLRGRLLLVMLALAVVPLIAASVLAGAGSRSALTELLGSDRAEIAAQAASSLDRVVLERALLLQIMGSNTDLGRALEEPTPENIDVARAVLADVRGRADFVRGLVVYDSDGGVLAGSSPEAEAEAPRNVTGQAWFREGIGDGRPTYINDVERAPTGGTRLIMADAVRSLPPEDINIGLLALMVDWDALTAAVLGSIESQFAERGSAVEVLAVDGDGLVVGATRPDPVLADRVSEPVAAALATAENGSVIAGVLDDERRLVGHGPLDNGGRQDGWFKGTLGGRGGILVTQDADEALASASTLQLRLAFVAALATLLAGLTAWVVSGRIAAPLVEAAEVAERLAQGDAEQEVEVRDGQDEAGRLNRALRGLLDYMHGLTEAAERVAKGDTSVRIEPKSEADTLSRAFLRVRDVTGELVAATHGLTTSALAGDLSGRGDPDRFEGGFRQVVVGINETLDAVVAPVEEAADVLQRVAERDLTARVEGDYRGDHARLKAAVNTALENVEVALTEVAGAAEEVASAAGQINGGSQTLAQGASEQASSLEEVSSSLQELSAMASQNTGHAREARSLAQAAAQAAENGEHAMSRLTETVDGIRSSSEATGRIVKTIDEIAFQTNLLALNAAVEAARAGESGKGFAVVAEEVRNLAMRSAEAARETSALIQESVERSVQGVAVQRELVEKLGEIHTGVDRVRDVIGEIAAASEQQTEGVSQINVAVEEMNGVTQTTAASAEESASAAEELTGQATRVRELVGSFRLRTAPVRTKGRATRSTGSLGGARVSAVPVNRVSEREASATVPDSLDEARLAAF